MTTRRATELLRRPGRGRAAYLELFFDLVFVLVLFQLSQQLLEHLSLSGAVETLVLLLAALVVWFFVVLFADTFDPERPLIQLLTVSIMFGTLVMAAAAPDAFDEKGLVFAGAYCIVRVGATAVAALLVRGHEAERNALRVLFWFGMSTVPWIAGALLEGRSRGALWITGAVVDYAGIGLGFPTPGLGRGGRSRIEVVVSEEHVAERYQQFFIVALGEPILVTGLTFANGEFTADRSAATLLAFATTALLWRIYIHRAGALLAQAMATTQKPRLGVVLTIYSHVLMVAGVVAIAVGDELVIAHPNGHTNSTWIGVIVGGPVLFLAGRSIFEYVVFSRVSRPRVIGALALVAVAPAMRPGPPLLAATGATLILAGVAVADALRTRRRPSEPPSPPG